MKKIALKYIYLILILLAIGITSSGQGVPQGFNYMAIARDDNGDILPGLDITIIIGIVADELGEIIIWEEYHDVTTNENGLFQIIVGEGTSTGNGSVTSFDEIDWETQPLYIMTTIDLDGEIIPMGSAQLYSVPYAMISQQTLTDLNNPFMMYGDTVLFTSSVDVHNQDPITENDALFEVKRQDGKTMFAVYNQGVRINVPLDDFAKGAKGGFSIGGFGGYKDGYTQDLFVLNKDSTRIYIDKTPDLIKGAKGGFSVGGFEYGGKATPIQEYLFITPDSARIYVKDTIDVGKGVKGGFSVGGFNDSKGTTTNFMDITQDNYFIGHQTGTKVIFGSALFNSVIGYQAGKELTTGDNNTILGYKADSSLTTGSHNIIIGPRAGFKLSTGNDNTLIGRGAGYNHTSQLYNVMIGTEAGFNVNGSFNTFMGINAGYKIRNGINNVFLGTNAGAMLDNGNGNTIIGIDAGRGGPWDWNVWHSENSTSDNTIIGNNAGYNLDVGDGNVFIGYGAGSSEVGTPASPASNKLYISNALGTLIYGNFSSGRIGLGTLNPGYKLDVAGDINISSGSHYKIAGTDLSAASLGAEPALIKGNLTATGPVSIDQTRQVIGGAAVISISDASTGGKGAVQLSNSYSGTSETLATTEKALKDGLATKVTAADGAGMIMGKIFSSSYPDELITIAGGTIALSWTIEEGVLYIIIESTNEKTCRYWYQAQKGAITEGNTGYVLDDRITIIVDNYPETNNGYEIHFGIIDANTGWCSVWLQYYKDTMVGHYIKY